jgi:hypothetical protein
MNSFITNLFYYNINDEDSNISNNTEINAIVNTNITYTIPPYQYNRIHAYPRGYKYNILAK